jgi:putative flippase GtrA
VRNISLIVIEQIKQATRFVRENDFATVRRHVLSHDAHPLLQFVKYGVCGAAAFIVHIVVVNIFGATVFPFHDEIADGVRKTNTMINNSLGFLVSCAFAYWTNINFVFKSGRHGRMKEIYLFFAISAVSFFAGLATVPVIFDMILEHFPQVGKYAQHIATLSFAVTSALVNFVCRKFIIFDK